MTRYYAGIGSTTTPYRVRQVMNALAAELDNEGWILNSGGAEGADQAFESGATNYNVFLPWDGFEGRRADGIRYFTPEKNDPAWYRAEELTDRFHPAVHNLKQGGRKLIGRDAYQVLGHELLNPVEFILCWTPSFTTDDVGRICNVSGGTGQAVRIAYAAGIPVFHLNRPVDVENFRILVSN